MALKAFALLLKRDIVRLFKNPAALGVVLVLIILPSLYTWYNVIAFWDPYDNTKDLRVCVVNEDAGTQNELTGEMNVGDLVVDALRQDNRLGWAFTSYDEAMDELRSGQAYAVFVIPSDFSAKLMTITSGSFVKPDIGYYVNEKSAPVATKIMDTGATELDRTINSTFRSTVGDVVVNVLDGVVKASDEERSSLQLGTAAELSEAIAALGNAQESLTQADQAFSQSQQTVADAQTALSSARTAAADAATLLAGISQEASDLQSALATYSSALSTSVSGTTEEMASVSWEASQAISQLASSLSTAQTGVAAALAQAQASLAQNQQLAQDLRTVAEGLADDDPVKSQLLDAADLLDGQDPDLTARVAELSALNQDVQDLRAQTDQATAALSTAIAQAAALQSSVSTEYLTVALPAISQSLTNLAVASTSLSSLISQQELLIDEADTLLTQTSGLVGAGAQAADQTSSLLQSAASNLDDVRSDILSMSDSGMISGLLDDGTIDPDTVASFIGAPTHVRTEQLYPITAYGVAMAPLFMNLTFWIGAFMLLVVMRQEVDTEGVEDASPAARFMERFAFFGVLVVLQSVVCCMGLEFIGIEAVNHTALFIASAVASLAYLSIIYSLSVTMQYLGKGLCIILVFAQIPGASGLYPIEMTSSFFQAIAPLFPFTYGIGAMREAICGFYGTTYIRDLLVLCVIALVFLFIGIKVRPLLANPTRMVTEQIHESGIFTGEKVTDPYRPFRAGQLIVALSEKGYFREELAERHERFQRRAPHIIRAMFALNVIVPVVTIVVMALTTTQKTVVLTIWLTVLVTTFIVLIAVKSVQESLKRQFSLGSMGDEELIEELRQGSSGKHRSRARASSAQAPGPDGDAGRPAGAEPLSEGSDSRGGEDDE